MPHATHDETADAMDEDAQVRAYLNINGGFDGVPEDGEFDQTDKADDAVDFGDISDDDELPEEEEATTTFEETADDGLPDNIYGHVPDPLSSLPAQHALNGHHDAQEDSSELFGDVEEVNDLFGDGTSSPEHERHSRSQVAPRPHGGLALPSKSNLALPTVKSYLHPRKTLQQSQESGSPPSYTNHEYSTMSPISMTSDDDEQDLDPQVALQRRLFKASKMRGAGEDVMGSADADMEIFHQLYSGYEKTQAPQFVELFPPRHVEYHGKTPLKPPRVVHPTKLSLDLLQDQERSFRSLAASNKPGHESTYTNSFVPLATRYNLMDDSDGDQAGSDSDENQTGGNISMQDLAVICQDWDIPSLDSDTDTVDFAQRESSENKLTSGDWDDEERVRAAKKRKIAEIPFSVQEPEISFDDPERAAAKIAKSVSLDLNDPFLLIDEHARRDTKKVKWVPGDNKRDSTLSRDIAKRYNISNDQAYDLLKENHQHKVRSTLGSMAVEHSYPAVKLQYPFYRVSLDNKAKRSFHRPNLELKVHREYRFQRPKHIKKKTVRGRDAKDVFAKAEDLSLGDSASLLLLEYSEEAPIMLSNFGMGNRLINYYRKLQPDDSTRPKKDIGEAQVLLTQDKSPFANFGHVDRGETVPTIQNGLYRAPVFAHQANPSDFVIGVSSTHENGEYLYLKNVENLHTVGQQFPLAEVPGQHSRKVTDAAKKRLRALAYRLHTKSIAGRRDKTLDNATLMPHLPGHDMPQTRSKMREFMKYERVTNRGDGSTGVWVPQPGNPVPDAETLRSWIRPEDVCLLDSMQVGVQHLSDIGISESKDADEDKDIGEDANVELQLAPWRATKNFLNACQGKAMLTLHGEGDPTGRGHAFSFVKTSMKGGFQAQGASTEDVVDARRRKDNGGHSYNVAKQQKQYDDSIRRIWEQQKSTLSDAREMSDDDMDDEPDRSVEYNQGRVNTPRSAFSTPAAFASRQEDDYMSQFSGQSGGRSEQQLVITRSGGVDEYGQPRPEIKEIITNPAIIREYRKRTLEKQYAGTNITSFVPTGDKEKDDFARAQLQKELARIQRNADRREAREKHKKAAKDVVNSPSAAASPGPSEIGGQSSMLGGGTDNTPQKGKGRSKDGTARKCANCGQVGHIKTNRKSVNSFQCPYCLEYTTNNEQKDGSHGRKKGGGGGGKRNRKPSSANGGEVSTFVTSSYSKFEL